MTGHKIDVAVILAATHGTFGLSTFFNVEMWCQRTEGNHR
jgi:hypothetical protein